MADSTTILDLISTSQASPGTVANALIDAASPATLYGRRASSSVALTWGYYGGKYLIAGVSTSIADGTITLTNSATNYLRAAQATGVVSLVTSAPTGWPASMSGYDALYEVVTSGGFVSTYTDWRTGRFGALLPVLTTTQKNAISSPPAGLLIYDSTLGKLCIRTGSSWETVTST